MFILVRHVGYIFGLIQFLYFTQFCNGNTVKDSVESGIELSSDHCKKQRKPLEYLFDLCYVNKIYVGLRRMFMQVQNPISVFPEFQTVFRL